MKQCPACAELIQDEAIKCRYCDEMLIVIPKKKWYFRASFIITALLCVGPLALPLIWVHPDMGIVKKLVLTVLVSVLTYGSIVLLRNSLRHIAGYYDTMRMVSTMLQ